MMIYPKKQWCYALLVLRRIRWEMRRAVFQMCLHTTHLVSPCLLLPMDGIVLVGAVVDNAMLQLLSEDKINVGTKLVIHGSELPGPPTPCHPLEAPAGLNLRLHTNMTRRARWWTRLGLIPQRNPLPTQLASVLGDGGIVGRLTVTLSRVYPQIYFERSNGGSLFRGERAHLRLVKEYQQQQETTAHQVMSEVEKEFEKERGDTCSKRGTWDSLSKDEIRGLSMGKDISELLENTLDPASLEGLLTTKQIELARSWQQRQADDKRRKINAEVQRRLSKRQKLYQATPLLKLRVLDTDGTSAMLTVWRPSEELRLALSEGLIFNMHYVVAAGFRKGSLHLTSTRQTRWERVSEMPPPFPDFDRQVTPLCLTMSDDLDPPWKEVDVVGVVFRICQVEQWSQTVYIVDHHVNVLALKFWGGLKECGVEEMISLKAVISVTNGSWRGYNRGRCGCVHITELSVVSVFPRSAHLMEAMTHLKDSIKDMNGILHKADMVLDGQFDERVYSPVYGHVDSVSDGQSRVKTTPIKESGSANDGGQMGESTDPMSTPKSSRKQERSREIRVKLKALGKYGTPSAMRALPSSSTFSGTHKQFKTPFKQAHQE